ncbi:MAG: lysostaphin resistance A-like protein [Candidatus Njordarchaeales archaeon]
MDVERLASQRMLRIFLFSILFIILISSIDPIAVLILGKPFFGDIEYRIIGGELVRVYSLSPTGFITLLLIQNIGIILIALKVLGINQFISLFPRERADVFKRIFILSLFFALMAHLISITYSMLVSLLQEYTGFELYYTKILGKQIYLALKLGPLFWFLTFLSVGILAPVAEELIFRWSLFGLLRLRGKNFNYAAMLSALIFSMFHFDLLYVPIVFILGFILAYLYEKFGNIVVPILCHCFVNTISLLILIFI